MPTRSHWPVDRRAGPVSKARTANCHNSLRPCPSVTSFCPLGSSVLAVSPFDCAPPPPPGSCAGSAPKRRRAAPPPAVGHMIASALVGKARDGLGLSRCTHMYTGAAPITRETLEYFGSLGIKILELYGKASASSFVPHHLVLRPTAPCCAIVDLGVALTCRHVREHRPDDRLLLPAEPSADWSGWRPAGRLRTEDRTHGRAGQARGG